MPHDACQAKCYGNGVVLGHGEGWPAGVPADQAAGTATLASRADKCVIKAHKWIKRSHEKVVAYSDGSDVGVSTRSQRMDDAIGRLVARVKAELPGKVLVVSTEGDGALYEKGRAADLTLTDADDATPQANTSHAVLLAELSKAATISGFDAVTASGPATVHVRVMASTPYTFACYLFGSY